jgi:hypothetical protein
MRNGISRSTLIILAISALSVGAAVAGGKGGGGTGGHINFGSGIQGESTHGSREGNIEIFSRSSPTGKPVHNVMTGNRVSQGNGGQKRVRGTSHLIVNYRHDKWAITPSLQLSTGSSHGK